MHLRCVYVLIFFSVSFFWQKKMELQNKQLIKKKKLEERTSRKKTEYHYMFSRARESHKLSIYNICCKSVFSVLTFACIFQAKWRLKTAKCVYVNVMIQLTQDKFHSISVCFRLLSGSSSSLAWHCFRHTGT